MPKIVFTDIPGPPYSLVHTARSLTIAAVICSDPKGRLAAKPLAAAGSRIPGSRMAHATSQIVASSV